MDTSEDRDVMVRGVFNLASALVLRGWTQEVYYSLNGSRADVRSWDTCFCALGAIMQACGLLGVRSQTPYMIEQWEARVLHPAEWNDNLPLTNASRRKVAKELRLVGKQPDVPTAHPNDWIK